MLEIFSVDLSETVEKERVERLFSVVGPDKAARLRRFYRWEDTLRGIYADLLIRYLLIRQKNIDNRDISFSDSEYGKPFLSDFPQFHFNLSHSGRWVVGAVDDRPVGIDVERIVPIDLDISKHYFSPDEHLDLVNQPDPQTYFFTLWTLKESYIKIVGKGLSLPLDSFSIRFQGPADIRIKGGGDIIPGIFFAQYEIDCQYKMAVCACHQDFPPTVRPITTAQLIAAFLDR